MERDPLLDIDQPHGTPAQGANHHGKTPYTSFTFFHK